MSLTTDVLDFLLFFGAHSHLLVLEGLKWKSVSRTFKKVLGSLVFVIAVSIGPAVWPFVILRLNEDSMSWMWL